MSERSAPQRDLDRSPSQVEIRRLSYPDLPEVTAIERRVFPTPWSLAMFVLELSKQSGICLAAVIEAATRRLLDLLALRHRLARDERRSRCCTASAWGSPRPARGAVRAGRRRGRPLHARGAPRPTPSRSISTSARASAPQACAGATTRTTARTRLVMWRTPRHAQGSLDDVPNPGPVWTILAIETELRRHLRRGDRQSTGSIRSQRDLLAGPRTRTSAGVVPEIASRHHLELDQRGRRSSALTRPPRARSSSS